VNADLYTYRVQHSPEDDAHVATVAEFPSLSWIASTGAEAYAGAVGLVDEVLADLAAAGEPVPQPLGDKHYSGRFVVRIPPEAHRRLAIEAAEQRISLNRLATQRLVAA
jgi:predicted RNase H-like HicB family nuclease